MALIIQKFGGTSVANIDRIKEIIPIIKSEISNNNQVIIIVSAMAGVTNKLVTLCSEVSSLNSANKLAEYDAALCTGEMVTSSLLALKLQEENLPARSIFAWQLPINTNYNYSQALVESISITLLEQCLNSGIIPIIAGFQGINHDNRLSTLGRGGSDTTAALIAARMKADRCDIYTDVEGVFTADPRIISKAKKINQISFEGMLELASSGAKVLHPRAAEIIKRYQITTRILSSFSSQASGTIVTLKDKIMESSIISGITSNKNLIKIMIKSSSLSFMQISNMIMENNNHIELMQETENNNCYSFIANLTDKNNLQTLLKNLQEKGQIDNFIFDTEIAILSIIGYALKSNYRLFDIILSQLEENNIKVEMIQFSETKISLLISDKDTEKTIYNLHNSFVNLGFININK